MGRKAETNIYHITYGPAVKEVYLHFWGCNFSCRACLCKKEIYDCHLEETKDAIYDVNRRSKPPERFLSLGQVVEKLENIDFKHAVFMGAEPTLDPQLPALAKEIHKKFQAKNTLLTNGYITPPLDHIDEVVLSIKAYTDEIHRQYTGRSNRRVLRNFIKLHQTPITLRSESVYIPEYIEKREIAKIAKFISRVDPNIPYRIDAYHPVYGNPWRQPTERELIEAVETASKYLNNVTYLKNRQKILYQVHRIF